MAQEDQKDEDGLVVASYGPSSSSTLPLDSLAELLQAPADLVKSSRAPQSRVSTAGMRDAGEGLFDHVDFLGPAESMKALFRLPYSREGVSLALHKVDRMLVVDNSLHELFPKQQRHYATDDGKTSAHGMDDQEDQDGDDHDPRRQDRPAEAGAGGPSEGLELLRLDAMQCLSTMGGLSTSAQGHEDSRPPNATLSPAFRVPPPPFTLPPAPEPFRQLLNWRFHDLRVVMGSNIQVYGTKEHPCVSALFHDADKDLELVTVCDAYLENVFASIPELALCMHSKGYLRSCNLVRTEDIPLLTLHGGDKGSPPSPPSSPQNAQASQPSPLFDPKMLDLNATTLLRFLKENCAAEGSTYLLYRDEGGTAVHLYDVTNISTSRQRRWKWLLAMLSYRFACRIYQQLHVFHRRRRVQLQQRQRRLLQTCLELLNDLTAMTAAQEGGTGGGGGQHESLCAAVQEQMAQSYLGGKMGAEGSRRTTPEAHVNETDLCKAQEHLAQGIAILRPLLKGMQAGEEDEEEEEENEGEEAPRPGGLEKRPSAICVKEEGEDEDEDIAFGSFGSSPAGPAGALTRQTSRDAQGRRPRSPPPSPSSRKERRRREGPSAASLMLLEQMLQMRRTMVHTVLQLAKVYSARHDVLGAMRALRDGAAQVSDAAWGARLADPQPWDDGTGLKDRVRAWVVEASGRVWEALADLTHSITTNLSLYPPPEPDAYSEGGGRESHRTPPESDAYAEGEEGGERERWVLEVVLEQVAALEDDAALGGALLGNKGSPKSSSSLSGLLLRDGDCSLSTMTLLYLHPHTAATILLHPDDKHNHTLEGSVLEATGPRCVKLLRVACALAYSRAITLLAPSPRADHTGLLRRFGDACNEVGKSCREVLVCLGNRGQGPQDRQATDLCGEAALWWLRRAEDIFRLVGDVSNVAVAALNRAGLHKAQARFAARHHRDTQGQTGGQSGVEGGEGGLEEGLSHKALAECSHAHEALGTREHDPRLWDCISEEMAMVHLMMGVARRQAVLGSPPPSTCMSSNQALDDHELLCGFLSTQQVSLAQERRVLDPLEKALDIYSRLHNLAQKAAVHYQMGSFLSRIWMGQADKKRARVRLSESMGHYNKAFELYYRQSPRDPTLLRIITDLSDLYLAVDAASRLQGGNVLCLTQALECMLKSRHSFLVRLDDDHEAPDSDPVRRRLTKTLQALVRATNTAPSSTSTSTSTSSAAPSATSSALHDKVKAMYRVLIRGSVEQRPFSALLSDLHDMYTAK